MRRRILNHQAHLREVTQRLFAGSEMNLEDEEASDEVSWMSAGVQQDQGELQTLFESRCGTGS